MGLYVLGAEVVKPGISWIDCIIWDICMPCTCIFMNIYIWRNSGKQNLNKKKRLLREREKYLIGSLCKSKVIFSQKRTEYILCLSVLSLWINQCGCCLNLLSWKQLVCGTPGSYDVLRVKHRDPGAWRWHRRFIKSGCSFAERWPYSKLCLSSVHKTQSTQQVDLGDGNCGNGFKIRDSLLLSLLFLRYLHINFNAWY